MANKNKKKKRAAAAAAQRDAEALEKKRKRNSIIGGVIVGILLIAAIAGIVYSIAFYDSPDSEEEATEEEATEEEEESSYELTGGVAATVNDVEIAEDDITVEIMDLREYYGYDDDDSWAEYLYDAGYTPESMREDLIDSYVEEELLSQAAEEYGIEISDEDAEEAFEEEYSAYGYDRDSYMSLIETYYGYTEEEYLEALKASLLEEALTEEVAPAEDVADEDVVAYVNDDLDTYGESRRWSAICISIEDSDDADASAEAQVKANHAYEAIASGEMTFEEAAAVYDDDADETLSESDLDQGWDCLDSLGDDVTEALYALEEVGDVSEPVLYSTTYYIIMLTDTYSAGDEETDVANIPDEVVESITETLVDTQISEDYEAWFEEYEDAADVVVSDMPDDLPYYVDMEAYEESLEEDDEESTDEDDEE